MGKKETLYIVVIWLLLAALMTSCAFIGKPPSKKCKVFEGRVWCLKQR